MRPQSGLGRRRQQSAGAGCAGSFDDGVQGETSSSLITVGGVGDSTDNPTPPDNPPSDDELYNLEPFLVQGDTQLTVTSSNPSQDDNLFLAVIEISAQAQATTEICSNGVDDDGDTLIDDADPEIRTRLDRLWAQWHDQRESSYVRVLLDRKRGDF